MSRRVELAVWAGLSTLAIALLIVAGRLQPAPQGLGTHQQLGLMPCDALRVTGRPCPTCGYTTAISWLMRGRPLKALACQPAGAAIGLALLAVPLAGVGALLARRPLLPRLLARVDGRFAAGFVALILASWVYKLCVFQ